MSRCVWCNKHVWPWQQAQDPAGMMRNDVHKVCRSVNDQAYQTAMNFADDMCREIGAPSPSEVYNLLHMNGTTMEMFAKRVDDLRKKYKIKRSWVLHVLDKVRL